MGWQATSFHDGVADSLMYTQTHVQSGRSMLQARPLCHACILAETPKEIH